MENKVVSKGTARGESPLYSMMGSVTGSLPGVFLLQTLGQYSWRWPKNFAGNSIAVCKGERLAQNS